MLWLELHSGRVLFGRDVNVPGAGRSEKDKSVVTSLKDSPMYVFLNLKIIHYL